MTVKEILEFCCMLTVSLFCFVILVMILLACVSGLIEFLKKRFFGRTLRERVTETEKQLMDSEKDLLMLMAENECNSGNIETLINFTNELDERLGELEEWKHEVDEHLLKLTDGYYGKLSFKEMLED